MPDRIPSFVPLGSAGVALDQQAPSIEWQPDAAVAARLRAELAAAVSDVAGPLTDPLVRMVTAAGKLLRPALTRAVARLGGCDPDALEVMMLAVAAELLHCATLVHDDVIDNAPVRRGTATVSAREGLPAAIVGGDLLIAAAGLVAARADPAASVIILETLAELCRGEARQDALRYRSDVSVEDVLRVAEAKTGALLRAACRLGASAAPADPTLRMAVVEFGHHFGIALQLLDDLLDVVSTPELAGKPVGADFAAGNLTYPALLACSDEPRLVELFRPDTDPAEQELARKLLAESDSALVAAAGLARRHARWAGESLLRDTPATAEAVALARWPASYVNQQLERKVGGRHRWLLATATPVRR